MVILLFDQDENDESKFKKIDKTHKQFRHVSANNLENLLKWAEVPISDKTDMINEVIPHCNTYKLYKGLYHDQPWKYLKLF